MTIARLSDDELLKEVARLAGDERSATARLIAALAEIDARRLYLGQGCPSLFVYCTRVLHLSEHAAYGRIEAARVARRFPVVLEMLVRGDLTLTTVSLLASHFTDSNHLDLLARAHRRSKREVEEIVAQVRPRPDVAAAVRKLPDRLETTALALDAVEHAKPTPARTPAPPPVCARPSAAVTPLAPSRYKLQLTIDRTTQEKLYLVCRTVGRSRDDPESRAGCAPERTPTPEVGCRRASAAGPHCGTELATHPRGGAA